MMNRLFLDTNIAIDFLAERHPFCDPVYELFRMKEKWEFFVSALSFTTIYYILRKNCEHKRLLNLLKDFASLVTIVPTDSAVIKDAINSNFSDFEDAVQYYTALSAKSDFIITRNEKDYLLSKITVLSPMDFLEHYG